MTLTRPDRSNTVDKHLTIRHARLFVQFSLGRLVHSLASFVLKRLL